MSNNLSLLVTTLVAALAGWAAATWHGNQHPPSTLAAAPAIRLAATPAAPAAAPISRGKAPAAQSSLPTSGPAETPPEMLEGQTEHQAEPERDAPTQLDAVLADEAYDSAWASHIETAVADEFYTRNPVGSALTDNDCRTTFCRLRVSHENSAAERAFIQAFATSARFINDGERGLYLREVDADGNAATLFYLARTGHRLPLTP